MTVIGFSFTKMLAEKKESTKGKVNISNNVSVTDVKDSKITLGTAKQPGLEFVFQFNSKFEPDLGTIELLGNVIYMEKAEKVKEILDSWKKDKKIPPDVLSDIYNTVLAKCNIEALILSRDINLPPPIPLPKVNPK
jgi:hypothetical protein